MITVEIFTKADCCLCDEAKEILDEVLPSYPAQLVVTDIESDPALFETYKEKIPVVTINGKESFIYKVHPVTLRKKLEKEMAESQER